MKRYEFTVGGMRGTLDGSWARYDEASAMISKTLDLFSRSEIDRTKLLADMKELTDRLAQAERERDKAIAERDELRRQNGIMENGINAVAKLIEESEGVYGFHLNGQSEEWDGLLGGGHLEGWLGDFTDALGMVTINKLREGMSSRDPSAEQGGGK